ncbi:MAG: MFS transporter [Deltaproteobacteria bacterium]
MSRTLTVLIGCFVCQMGIGTGYAFSPLLKHIAADFEWSRAAFSVAASPLLIAMALGAPLAGTLAERFGSRWVLTGSALLLAASLGSVGLVAELWHLMLLMVGFGLALSGLGDVVTGAVASRWVSRRRGMALGLVFIGSNVGGALVPIAAESMASHEDWRFAITWIGIGTATLILPFALFAVRDRPTGEPTGPAGNSSVTPHPSLTLPAAIRTRSFWILAFLLTTFYFYYIAVNVHLVALLTDLGISDARAAASLGFAVALGIVAKLASGAVADRFDTRRVLMANFALVALASGLLMGAGRPVLLATFLVAHGFATAAQNVMLPLAVVYAFGVEHMARIYGTLMVALLPGGVLGPIFAGWAFDRLGDYRLALALFLGLNLTALASLGWLRQETAAETS